MQHRLARCSARRPPRPEPSDGGSSVLSASSAKALNPGSVRRSRTFGLFANANRTAQVANSPPPGFVSLGTLPAIRMVPMLPNDPLDMRRANGARFDDVGRSLVVLGRPNLGGGLFYQVAGCLRDGVRAPKKRRAPPRTRGSSRPCVHRARDQFEQLRLRGLS